MTFQDIYSGILSGIVFDIYATFSSYSIWRIFSWHSIYQSNWYYTSCHSIWHSIRCVCWHFFIFPCLFLLNLFHFLIHSIVSHLFWSQEPFSQLKTKCRLYHAAKPEIKKRNQVKRKKEKKRKKQTNLSCFSFLFISFYFLSVPSISFCFFSLLSISFYLSHV